MGDRALLTDLYQLTMAQAYLDAGLHETPATFSLFYRTLPEGWRYLVAAGLEDALAYLDELAFDDEDLAYLESTGLFSAALLELLRTLRFAGDVRAMPEGTLVFPHEPLLELTAPALVAQLVESYLLNQVHLQTLVASKAARSVDAVHGRYLVDFSLRRTHGADAALKVARASRLAGFDATSNVLAGARYGIPVAGTMAHSFVEAFTDELEAFRAFARSFPEGTTLLVDTYDTPEGARRAAVVAHELGAVRAVRLDSGDLAALAREVRTILDEAGLPEVTIFASGNLDEHAVARLLETGAPIDGFGIGSRMGTSADAPYLDMVYKLVDFGGRPVLKLSKGKGTWPGAKQVWRVVAGGGETPAYDVVGLAGEDPPLGGEPLLRCVPVAGRPSPHESLEDARSRCADLRALLEAACPLEVRFSAGLTVLRDDLAGRLPA
jgi:nicotinate phosphoribosyltransferase